MDYAKVFETLINETTEYLTQNRINTIILGISGGLDSTVTAAICSEIEKRNPDIKFIGVNLPCNSNSERENDSALTCMRGFCKPGNYWVENLQKEYMLLKSTCELRTESTSISQGNIKARLRMIYLYNLASTTNGIVMDTDNLTEHYLGFFTIHGDVADFNPIGCLWKHEVYELAKYLLYDYYNNQENSLDGVTNKQLALKSAINIIPTDGNGVNNLGDIGQIAPSFAEDTNIEAYTKVDDIIKTYLDTIKEDNDNIINIIENLYNIYGYNTVNDIFTRIRNTEYKRKRLPITINRDKINEEE